MRRLFLAALTAATAVLLPQLLLAAEDAKSPDRPRPEMRRERPNPEVMFQRLDANRDGAITPDELPAGMPPPLRQLLLEEIKKHDGKLTPEALTEVIKQHRPGAGPEVGPGWRGPGQGRGPGAGQGFGFGAGRPWNPEGGPGLRGPGQGRGPGGGQGFGFGAGRPWNPEGGPDVRGPGQGRGPGAGRGFGFGAGRPWNPQGGPGWRGPGQGRGLGPGGPWRPEGRFAPPWQGQRFGPWVGCPWHPGAGWYARMDRDWRPGARGQQYAWQHGGYYRGFDAGMKEPKVKGGASEKGVEAKLAVLEKEATKLEKVGDSLRAKLAALEKRQEEVRAALEKATKPEKKRD
jgi:hypothetical protein